VNEFEIRIATKADPDMMRAVLDAAGLSTQEILDPDSFYWVAKLGRNLVGTCGLEVDGRCGLARSVAVAEGSRGKRQGEA
jgi:N-acetylglutamate synthase-like GNAT family acetyltransferase